MRIIHLGLLVVVLCGVGCRHKDAASMTEGDAMQMMKRYSDQGQYMDAIHLGQDWLQSHPNTPEMAILIGDFYVMQARSSNMDKEQVLSHAVEWFNRGLQMQQDLPILTSAARGFESAGDLGGSNQCIYFKEAVDIMNRIIIEDTALRSKATRNNSDKWQNILATDENQLTYLKSKLAKRGCK